MAVMALHSFLYIELLNPAQDLRLLHIKPGRDDATVDCSLSVFDLRTAPIYAAISYTWGDPQPTRTITINGNTVQVGINCHYALWQVRQKSRATYYWIDALCIDQSNMDEKNRQVQIMNEIFSRAGCVLVSLGSGSEYSYFLMENLRGAPGPRDDSSWRTWFSKAYEDLGIEHTANLGESLLWLSELPFWNRIWIVQEMILGHNIKLLFGSDSMEWLFVRGLILHIPSELRRFPAINGAELAKALRSTTMTSLAYHIEYRRKQLSKPPGLPRLLPYFGSGHCSNTLDRIYAFLHLVAQPSLPNKCIIVDYNKHPFDLAKECLEYLDEERGSTQLDVVEQTKVILHTLGIDSTNTELRNLVSRRSRVAQEAAFDVPLRIQEHLHGTSASPDHLDGTNASEGTLRDATDSEYTDLEANRPYLAGLYDLGPNDLRRIAYTYGRQSDLKLYKTNDGSLTGNFVAHKPSCGSPKGLHIDVLQCDHRYRTVLNASSVALLLCEAAQPGDYVVALSNARFSTKRRVDPCVVLRHCGAGFYGIIGQGLKAANERFCPGGPPCFCRCKDGDYHAKIEGPFKVYFCKEDMMALAAQDLADGDQESEHQPDLSEVSAQQLRRLCTAVTSCRWSSFAIAKLNQGNT